MLLPTIDKTTPAGWAYLIRCYWRVEESDPRLARAAQRAADAYNAGTPSNAWHEIATETGAVCQCSPCCKARG